jgi:nicotinate-nucleotide adenylyltransferase
MPGRIGLFGGTFNPIHYGHLRAVRELKDEFPLESVVFIPSNNPPLKRDVLVAARHRYEMVELAIAGIAGFELSDIECSSEGVSYTINTIEAMKRKYNDDALYFILGLDAFLEMHKWYRAGEILANIPLIVMARPTVEMARIKESPYIDTESIGRDGSVAQARLRNGKRLSVVHITPVDISSTDIRRSIREGGTIKYLLPESVESYIIKNGLYK